MFENHNLFVKTKITIQEQWITNWTFGKKWEWRKFKVEGIHNKSGK